MSESVVVPARAEHETEVIRAGAGEPQMNPGGPRLSRAVEHRRASGFWSAGRPHREHLPFSFLGTLGILGILGVLGVFVLFSRGTGVSATLAMMLAACAVFEV